MGRTKWPSFSRAAVCVLFVLYFHWQIAHVRDAILLLTYSPSFLLHDRMETFSLYRPGRLPSLSRAGLQLNLKFLRNPTKHGAEI